MKIKPLRSSNMLWAVVKVCAIVIITFLCPCFAVTGSNTRPFKRLAILSSEAIRKSGLSDLLTVQMQELTDVELIERDMLQKVLDEVALSMMLGAGQSENRRKAGALLKADMLVLLSLEEAGDKKNVKVVVSDCSNGARLRIGWVLFDDFELEDTSRELIKIVNETLERFKEGVKQIIGISHFVSRNLVHDYDYLQASYAYLLENALSLSPGVAVIEIEEAQSIRRESELTADTESGRVIPLFVEGEFTIQDAVSKKQPKINMTIRISDRSGVIEQFDGNDLSVDKVAEFIADDAGREILRLSKSPSVEMFDKEQQFLALINSASEFAGLGAWEHSTGLREAALLLKPDSVKQRIKLIDEYCQMRKVIKAPRFSFEQIEYDKWRLSFGHLEYMIYNQLINIRQATELSGKSLRSLPDSRFANPTPNQPTEAESFKKDFLQRVYPEILKLKPSSEHPHQQQKEYEEWYKHLIRHVYFRRDGGGGSYHDKDDLNLFWDLHNNAVPEGMVPSSLFIGFLNDHLRPSWRNRISPEIRRGYFSEQEFLDFITEMSRSKKTLSSFYGRYALLYHEYYQREKQGRAMEDPRDKVESLVSEIERYDFFISEEDIFAKNEAKKVRGHESRGYDILYNETKGLQQKIEEYVKSESAE